MEKPKCFEELWGLRSDDVSYTSVNINVLNKKTFETRITNVFKKLESVLVKSFGPYGSNSFICKFPYTQTTKDGYTIMKNLKFFNTIDNIISDMALDICRRLNMTVGDGTTTSILATNALYKAYKTNDYFKKCQLSPREVLNAFETVKNDIIDELKKNAKKINNSSIEEMVEWIGKVVYISSNGNTEITEMIKSLYSELKYPAINVGLSSTGNTNIKIVEGYPIDIRLTDNIYINNDDRTMHTDNFDILIYSHKVTESSFKKIILPLNDLCAVRKRRLMVIAPYYDEVAIQSIIRQKVLNEYQKTKSINLILANCSSRSTHDRLALEDLAMLVNTVTITRDIENEIIERLDQGEKLLNIFNIDYRGIIGSTVLVHKKNPNSTTPSFALIEVNNGDIGNIDTSKMFRVGYCKHVSMGLKNATFNGFYYNEELRQKHIKDAEEQLKQAQEQFSAMGTFNIEISLRQKRLHSLSLKMGFIEVGAETEIMRNYLKDSVDDAVRAAESAYNNGVILGCNITLLSVLYNKHINYVLDDGKANVSDTDTLYFNIYEILYNAFFNVFKAVIDNMLAPILKEHPSVNKAYTEVRNDSLDIQKTLIPEDAYNEFREIGTISLYTYIMMHCVNTGEVYDVVTKSFTDDIVNSCETDIEILKATIDLISLIISGNQLVISNI